MGQGNHSEFFVMNVVDDAVGKFPQREATPIVSPGRAKTWVSAQERHCSFVLQNKRKTHFGIGFAGIEDCTFG